MGKLGGGYGFTKIDLADAYSQVRLGPESRKRLALSTHYYKMLFHSECHRIQVTSLVSGKNAKDHYFNLKRLLDRLRDKGLRCRREKCCFAQPQVEYLGHMLKRNGIHKGHKVDAVLNMPAPADVTSLKSFWGSVQFYAKFLPPSYATEAEPFYRLTKKNVEWNWGSHEQSSFQRLKSLLSSDAVLTHYNLALPLGIACDASSLGIGGTLFHRYPDGSERPIANVSKILSKSQRNYSQIQKEALAIVLAVKKFFQYLFGQNLILVTDHMPLLAVYGNKKSSGMVANRLARWALYLN